MTIAEVCLNLHNTLGSLIESYKAKLGPNQQYCLEIAARLPLIFFIHQWMLLAPYSDYTILDTLLVAIRILGAIIMVGCQEVRKSNLLLIYSTLSIDMIVGWMVDTSYWLIHNEAAGECSEDARLFGEMTNYWRTPLWSTTVGLTFYIVYLNYRYHVSQDSQIGFGWMLGTILFLHSICASGFFLYYLSPFYFYIYKIPLSLISVTQVCYILCNDDVYVRLGNQNFRNFRNILPGRWVSRDLNATFALIYFCSCWFIDMTILGTEMTLNMEYLVRLIGRWTSTLSTLICLASALCILSNIAVAISRFLVLGSVNFKEAFDVNIGSKLFLNTITLSFQAGVFSRNLENRSDNMAFVLLLSMCLIVCQLWDLSENHFLSLLNSGDHKSFFAYLRVILFFIVIITAPTYFNIYLASNYNFDLWPLMNITGVIMLLSRAVVSAVEFFLVSLSWYVEDHNERVADVIYYTRVLKGAVMIISLIMNSYCRLVSPYFEGPVIFNFTLVVADCIAISRSFVRREWMSFQQRRNLIKQIHCIPEATQDQISGYENDCAICYGELQSGKILPCGHIFHKDCLKKWIQVKPTCPYCNGVIPSPYAELNSKHRIEE